jgi:hypothetical protein
MIVDQGSRLNPHILSSDTEITDVADDMAEIQRQPNMTPVLNVDSTAQNPLLNLSSPFATDENDSSILGNIISTQSPGPQGPPLNMDAPPSVAQDLAYDMSLFSSEIFSWSPILPTALSPENLDLYLDPASPVRAQSRPVASTESNAASGEDLAVHLSLLRHCMRSGHKEADGAIFGDLMKQILARAPHEEIEFAMKVVFKEHGKGLAFETVEARFDAAISERQQHYGFDHPATIQMCLGLATFLLLVVEIDKEQENWEQESAEYGLERAKDLLDRVLRIGFDDEVVRASSRCDSPLGNEVEEPEPRQLTARRKIDETDLMEIYATGCAEQPLLPHAIIQSTVYTELHQYYKLMEVLDGLIEKGLEERCVVSRVALVLTYFKEP